jgi:fluoride ion exporter CrcB/FEX
VIDGLGKTIFTLAVSLSAVRLGLNLSTLRFRILRPLQPPRFVLRHLLRTVSFLVYAATIPAYLLLPQDFRHQATAAMLFSFPGTLTRYILAMTLTPKLKLFPLGTFAANVLGTGLLGAFHILQRTGSLPSHNACSILQGLMDGFCGCLTTVSTFAVEVGALERNRAWLYVALSWAASQLLLLLIMGPSWLRQDISESRACGFD